MLHPSLLRTFPGALLVGFLGLLCAGAGARAGDSRAAVVLLERPDGEVLRFEGLGFSSPDPREHGAVFVRFEGAPAPAGRAAGEALIELAAGGRVRGLVLGGEGEELHLEVVGGSRLPLSIEEVARLSFEGRVPRGWTGRIEPAEAGDRVYFARGGGLDRIDGTLLSFDEEGLRIDSALGPFQVRWREVAAVLVAPLGDAPPRPTEGAVAVVVDLIDGSRLSGELLHITGDGVGLRTRGGRGLRLVAGAVAEVFVVDERLAFLSDMPPDQVEEGSPFGDELGLTWPHRRDLSVSGAPLTAGGRRWSRGLGVHAPSRLTWRLDGGWSELRGSVAIDDEVLRLPGRGSVRFRILVDGEERFLSRVVRGGEAPLALPPIDLQGARALVLEVDMADELHVADRANWLRPLLVRRP
jgi:hypothetical protein